MVSDKSILFCYKIILPLYCYNLEKLILFNVLRTTIFIISVFA